MIKIKEMEIKIKPRKDGGKQDPVSVSHLPEWIKILLALKSKPQGQELYLKLCLHNMCVVLGSILTLPENE